MEQIYLLKNGDSAIRIYGIFLGGLKAEIADYWLYADYRGLEWLHVHVRKEDIYILLPFLRLDSGEEYFEYLEKIMQ